VGDASSSLASMLFVLRRQQGRLAELLPAMESLVDEAPSAPLAWDAALAVANLDAGSREVGEELFEKFAVGDFGAIPRDWYWFVTIALLAEVCVALQDADRAARLADRRAAAQEPERLEPGPPVSVSFSFIQGLQGFR